MAEQNPLQNQASVGPADTPGETLPTPAATPWKALLPALAVSLVAHAVLLSLVRIRPAPRPAQPALVVTLRPAVIAAAAAPAPAAPSPPAAVPVAAPVAVPAPALPMAPAPSPRPAPPPPPPPPAAPVPPAPAAPSPARASPPAPVPAPAMGSAPEPDAGFRDAGDLSEAPVPQSEPGLGTLRGRIVGRRLAVTVWVDAAGVVRKAEVVPNELSPEWVAQLEAAIGKVRFRPGLQDGQPTGAVVRTLLCFDDAGLLDARSPECWQVEPPAAR